MSKIELDEKNDIKSTSKNESVRKLLGTIIGIISLLVGIFAWLTLYHNDTLGISLAIIGIILSFMGFKGRYRNFAIGGLVVSGTLLLTVGIVYAIIEYVFSTIQ